MDHGSLYRIPENIPLTDIVPILDNLQLPERSQLIKANAYNIIYVFDRLLIKILEKAPKQVSGMQLWKWLNFRHALEENYDAVGEGKKIKELLEYYPDLCQAMTETAFDQINIDGKEHIFFYKFPRITLFSIKQDDLSQQLMNRFFSEKDNNDKRKFFYRFSFVFLFACENIKKEDFERLYNFADQNESFKEIREQSCKSEVPDNHYKIGSIRIEKQIEEEAKEAADLRDFKKNQTAIRNGNHLNWLQRIALIYLAQYPADIDKSLCPSERLVQILGDENAARAIEGLLAFLEDVFQENKEIPRAEIIASSSAKEKFFPWWLIVIAGLDELWKREGSINLVPEDVLKSAIAIDLIWPTEYINRERKIVNEHQWKTKMFTERAELVNQTYFMVAVSYLEYTQTYIPGLDQLLNSTSLALFHKNNSLELLRKFPKVKVSILRNILTCAMRFKSSHDEIISIARKELIEISEPYDETQEVWLTAAYIISPNEFQDRIKNYMKSYSNILWMIQDFFNDSKISQSKDFFLDISQLQYIADTILIKFPDPVINNEEQRGQKNVSDIINLFNSIINRLAHFTSIETTNALQQFLKIDKLATIYKNFIKQALVKQLTRRRDAEYLQPDWHNVVSTLENSKPANVADLHTLTVKHLQDLKAIISSGNTDQYKVFWNENSYKKVTTPKSEESCRHRLVELLRPLMKPFGVQVEPEGHMANDKRADIVVQYPGQKIVIELKRDNHAEVWSAIEGQLDRFYTCDQESQGYGIYGVFWFGESGTEKRRTPSPPIGIKKPRSAKEMENALLSKIPQEMRHRIVVVVLDVSGIIN